MAGSWHHIVNETGVYEGASLLENGGDVEEFAQQAYGMVWYLASTLALRSQIPAGDWVLDAARNASIGLDASPSSLFKKEGPDAPTP